MSAQVPTGTSPINPVSKLYAHQINSAKKDNKKNVARNPKSIFFSDALCSLKCLKEIKNDISGISTTNESENNWEIWIPKNEIPVKSTREIKTSKKNISIE